jgi:hypothetical protein
MGFLSWLGLKGSRSDQSVATQTILSQNAMKITEEYVSPDIKPMPKPKYEIGEFIGAGSFSVFFTIKDHPRLGVRIVFGFPFDQHKELLETELRKGQILRQLQISVPKYVGLIPVLIREEVLDQLKMNWDRGKIADYKVVLHFEKHINLVVWGLIIEQIDNDITTIHYKKKEELYEIERQKVQNLSIEIHDSFSGKNVLWSKKNNKLYFIDFDRWVFPSSYNLKVFR